MLRIGDIIKEKSKTVLQQHCSGAYGNPKLTPAFIERLSDTLAVEIYPLIMAEAQEFFDKVMKAQSVPQLIKVECGDSCVHKMVPNSSSSD